MQADLSSNEPLLDIEIMGVNWTGLESENQQATDGKNIPWLQDVDSDNDGSSDAWSDWGAEHLDLVVLGAHNEPLANTNLISASLNEQENYAAVRDALVDAAMDSQKPWHNFDNPMDIDSNDTVVPLDALLIVNRLEAVGAGQLPPPGVHAPTMFYDSNGDGDLTSLDVLLVVNLLNNDFTSAGGEGEALEASSLPDGSSPVATAHSPRESTDERLRTLNPARTDSPIAPSRDALASKAETDLVFRTGVVDWTKDIYWQESRDIAAPLDEAW